MKIYALKEGCFSVDNTKKFIPFDSAIHQAKDRPGSLFIHVQPFLIKSSKHLILLDSGLGLKNEDGEMQIHHNIKALGYDPKEVDLVLMSHLHNDHTAGLLLDNELAFPNAKIVVQQKDWEYASQHPYYEKERLQQIGQLAKIDFVNGNGKYTPEISYQYTAGHCPHHQVWILKESNQTVFFGGDILPEPEQLLRKFLAKYDFEPQKALDLRMGYGKQAAKENWTCLFYHAKNTPVAKVILKDEQFAFQEV